MTKQNLDFHLTGSAWASLALAKSAIQHIPHDGRIVMILTVASKIAFGEPTVAYLAAKAAIIPIHTALLLPQQPFFNEFTLIVVPPLQRYPHSQPPITNPLLKQISHSQLLDDGSSSLDAS